MLVRSLLKKPPFIVGRRFLAADSSDGGQEWPPYNVSSVYFQQAVSRFPGVHPPWVDFLLRHLGRFTGRRFHVTRFISRAFPRTARSMFLNAAWAMRSQASCVLLLMWGVIIIPSSARRSFSGFCGRYGSFLNTSRP